MSNKLVLRFLLVSVFASSSLVLMAQELSQPETFGPAAPVDAQTANQDKPSPTQSANPPQGQTSSDTTPGSTTDKPQDKDKDKGTSNDRLLFALPNFLTLENGKNVPPLTPRQKFRAVAKGAFDPIQIPWYMTLSALSQAEDSEPAYGQGWEGYGKRFATTAADGTIENFMVGAVMPSIFHQDPRFFQSSEGSFTHRAWYAVSRIVITRGDSGHSQFNVSEVFGSALSASISTFSYHPRSTILRTPNGPRFIASDRTLTNAASVWGSQLGYDTITIDIKEFWPDVHRKLAKKHSADATASPKR